MNSTINTIRCDGGKITEGSYASLDDSLNENQKPGACLIFAAKENQEGEVDDKSTYELLTEKIRSHFRIPPLILTDGSVRACGYFGAEVTEKHGSPHQHYSYARFQAKVVEDMQKIRQGSSSPKKKDYRWHTVTVFTAWNKSGSLMSLCFGLHEKSRGNITNAFREKASGLDIKDAFALYILLLDEINSLYDKSVWSCRDEVRKIEENRPPLSPEFGIPQPNYLTMHEVTRHCLHAVETLSTAHETIQSMLSEHAEFVKQNVNGCSFSAVRKNLQLHSSFIRGLIHRSHSVEQRLKSEIGLAYNLVAQYNSHTGVKISEATAADSAAMKTISFLGLTFLPGTFICAIFSMSFFQYNPPSETEPPSFTVSDQWWLYPAVAVPVTLATVVIWYFTNRFLLRRTNKKLKIHSQQDLESLKRTNSLGNGLSSTSAFMTTSATP